MYKQIIALALLFTASNAQLNGWVDCGTTMATIHEIRVTNCTQTPCTFVRSATYEINVLATASVSSNTLNFELLAFLPPVTVGIPLTSGNACDSLIVGQCPVMPGNTFHFRYFYTVNPALPTAPNTFVQSLVRNDENVIGICFNILATVTN